MYKVIIQEENGKEIKSMELNAFFGTGLMYKENELDVAVMTVGDFKLYDAIKAIAESAAVQIHEMVKEKPELSSKFKVAAAFNHEFKDKYASLMASEFANNAFRSGGGQSAHKGSVEINIEIGGRRDE